MTMVQIRLEPMRSLIRGLETAIETGHSEHSALTSQLRLAGASEALAQPVMDATIWAEDTQPGLRRRLALAEQVAASTSGMPAEVSIDESLLSMLSPEEAADLAEAIGEAFTSGTLSPEQIAALRENAIDPYFAEALFDQISPEDLADFLGRIDYAELDAGNLPLSPATEQNAQMLAGLRTAWKTFARDQTLQSPGDNPAQAYGDELAEQIMTGDWAGAVGIERLVGDVDSYAPGLGGDLPRAAEVVRQYGELSGGGVLAAPPSLYMREWIGNKIDDAVLNSDLIDFANGEGIHDDVFAPLEDLEVIRDPEGRAFFSITEASQAGEISALTELLAGGQPSLSDPRRDENGWSYSNSGSPVARTLPDVDLVLRRGGAVVTTPEGIVMGQVANTVEADLGGSSPVPLPNPSGVWAHRGGTMYGELFLINRDSQDPAASLQTIIEDGTMHSNGHPLYRVLRHETVHAEQWADFGVSSFIWEYFVANDPNDPCNHALEIDADLEDGGYNCP